MKSKIFLCVALVTIWLTSCKNDEKVTDDADLTEIYLSSGISAQTRASFPATDKQIAAGETVTVYVDDATFLTQLYGNNKLIADGYGGLKGGIPMFFPKTGNNVDIYAFHTNAILGAAYPAEAITHSIRADQSALAGYVASDMLYAVKKGVAKQSTAVALTFHHMLSKIQVGLVAGAGLTFMDIAKVEILNTKPDAVFTSCKYPIWQKIAASGNITPIKIGKDVSLCFTPDCVCYNDAIIVPQVVSGKFIQVTLANGAVLVYNLPLATTFNYGKKYIYHITVNLTGLTVSSSIEDWDAAGFFYGEAEMEE